MNEQDLERRLERLEERMDAGFADLRSDMTSLFRNGPLSRLDTRLTVVETKQGEHLESTNRLRVWVYGIVGALIASGGTYAVACIFGGK